MPINTKLHQVIQPEVQEVRIFLPKCRKTLCNMRRINCCKIPVEATGVQLNAFFRNFWRLVAIITGTKRAKDYY